MKEIMENIAPTKNIASGRRIKKHQSLTGVTRGESKGNRLAFMLRHVSTRNHESVNSAY
jgi:hypothetical protein